MTSARRHAKAQMVKPSNRSQGTEQRHRWLGDAREGGRLSYPTPDDMQRLLARGLGEMGIPKVYIRGNVAWMVHSEPPMPPPRRPANDSDGTNNDT
jgi:hypothetical protein